MTATAVPATPAWMTTSVLELWVPEPVAGTMASGESVEDPEVAAAVPEAGLLVSGAGVRSVGRGP